MSDIDDDELLTAARSARSDSHAPYSDFEAGAAVHADDGSVHVGVIVENVSLGLAMCAERVAMFSAVAAGTRPHALALVAPTTSGGRTWPCGACLQVALELGGPDMRVVVADAGHDEPSEVARVEDLIPRGPRVRTEDDEKEESS